MESTLQLPALHPISKRQPKDVLRIAHRGAAGAERYDVSSLTQVAEFGAHLVEFDLHVTGDDHLVVRHDPVITCNGKAVWLSDHPLCELRDVLGRTGYPEIGEFVPMAAEAGLGLYADIKSLTPRAAARLVTILRSEGMADRTILASPRSDITVCCAQVGPEIPRAVLFASTLEEPVQLAQSIGAQFVHPCWENQPHRDGIIAGHWLDRVRSRGLGVICWHEERSDVLRRLYALGVDGICTDDPGRLYEIASQGHPDI